MQTESTELKAVLRILFPPGPCTWGVRPYIHKHKAAVSTTTALIVYKNVHRADIRKKVSSWQRRMIPRGFAQLPYRSYNFPCPCGISCSKDAADIVRRSWGFSSDLGLDYNKSRFGIENATDVK